MNSERIHDQNNLLLLKQGYDSALTYFYTKYKKKVYAVAFFILKDRYIAEDILQEVFIHFWKNREQLNDENDVWVILYVMSKQKSLNQLRSMMRYENHKTKHLYEQVYELNNESFSVKDIRNLVELAMQKMTPTQQRIFQLSREEGLTHSEIAQLLSVSTNTVKNHMVSALSILRRYFKGYEFLMLYFFFFF